MTWSEEMLVYTMPRKQKIDIFIDRFSHVEHVLTEHYDVTIMNKSIIFMDSLTRRVVSNGSAKAGCVIMMALDGSFIDVDPHHKMVFIDETLDDLVDASLHESLFID